MDSVLIFTGDLLPKLDLSKMEAESEITIITPNHAGNEVLLHVAYIVTYSKDCQISVVVMGRDGDEILEVERITYRDFKGKKVFLKIFPSECFNKPTNLSSVLSQIKRFEVK